jgi:hypothetical protein
MVLWNHTRRVNGGPKVAVFERCGSSLGLTCQSVLVWLVGRDLRVAEGSTRGNLTPGFPLLLQLQGTQQSRNQPLFSDILRHYTSSSYLGLS